MTGFRKMMLGLATACVLSASTAGAGMFSVVPITGDADSGISTANTYTHAIDFTGPGETINGVPFVTGPLGDQTATLGYNLQNTFGTFLGNTPPVGGNIGTLFTNFWFQPQAGEVLTLTGLTAGQTYQADFYGVAFGAAGARYNTVTDNQGGSILYDENQTNGTASGTILRDTYTATGSSITFTWTINTTDSNLGDPNITSTNDSYHQYGFSNYVAAVPEPSSLALIGLGGMVVLGFARRRKTRMAPSPD